MDATARFVAIVAVAAFVTERVVAAITYLIDAFRPADDRDRARDKRKLVVFGLAAIIAYVVVDRANLRLLQVLEVANVHPLVDFWLTWLVVVAGADRVHSMLGGGEEDGGSGDRSETPVVRVEVDGTVRDLHRVG